MLGFTTALKKVLLHEGGYCNDPVDRGGETYRGVARKFHPTWEGWQIIDELKLTKTFPKYLESNLALSILIEDFYKKEFWDKLRCDEINDSLVAGKLFDIAVNMGCRHAVKMIQRATNSLLDDSAQLFEDGKIGARTLSAITEVGIIHGYNALLVALRILQRDRYLEIVKNNPSQEKFLKGWLNRASA